VPDGEEGAVERRARGGSSQPRGDPTICGQRTTPPRGATRVAARREIALTQEPRGRRAIGTGARVPPPRQAQKWPRTPARCGVASHPRPPGPRARVGTWGRWSGAVGLTGNCSCSVRRFGLHHPAAPRARVGRGPGPQRLAAATERTNERAMGGGAHDGHVHHYCRAGCQRRSIEIPSPCPHSPTTASQHLHHPSG